MKKKIKIRVKKPSQIKEYDKGSQNKRRYNCRTDRYETEKEFKKIDKKEVPVEKITKQITCRLKEDDTSKPSTICLQKNIFDLLMDRLGSEILDTEMEELDEESRHERLTRAFGSPWRDLIRLSNGIAEKKKAKKKNIVPGNTFHKKEGPGGGRFTSRRDAGSWSLQYASKGEDCSKRKCGVARMDGSGRELFQQLPCGRANRDNKCGTKKENIIPEVLKHRWIELLNH